MPEGQGCCGALSIHAGREEESLGFAREPDRTRSRGTARRHPRQRRRLRIEPEGLRPALREATRPGPRAPPPSPRTSRDVTEFLAVAAARRAAPPDPRPRRLPRRLPPRARPGHPRAAARAAARRSRGSTLVEIPDGDQCCGSAGIYNLVEPEPPTRSGSARSTTCWRRSRTFSRPPTRAARSRSASSCGSAASPCPPSHPIEILDASIANRPPVARPSRSGSPGTGPLA